MLKINMNYRPYRSNANKISMIIARSIALLAILAAVLTTTSFRAEEVNLPQRDGPRPETTDGVPHVQIGISPDLEISEALLLEVSKLPGVEIRPSIVSLRGSKGFWLNESLALEHPEVIVSGREFAHMHPDGSLHASLAPMRAEQAVMAGWATPHPWANKRDGWEGLVMLYTPKSTEESKVVFQLILDSYNFVTGEQ